MQAVDFTLRRLEMAMPLMEFAKNQDPQALVKLAALTLADEQTLKLVKAGNAEAMQVYTDQAYDMAAEEVAEALGFFIRASQRFSLRLSGLKAEEVNRHMKKLDHEMRVSLGIELQEESAQ